MWLGLAAFADATRLALMETGGGMRGRRAMSVRVGDVRWWGLYRFVAGPTAWAGGRSQIWPPPAGGGSHEAPKRVCA
jgi:hypothetical protein